MKKLLSLLLIATIINSSIAFASCEVEREKDKALIQSFQKSILLYKENQVLYIKEIGELKTQNNDLSSALEKSRHDGVLGQFIYFGLGMLGATAVMYATKSR